MTNMQRYEKLHAILKNAKILMLVLFTSSLFTLAFKNALAEPLPPLPPLPSPHIHSKTKPHLRQIMDVDDARHLLMRTGFGAAPEALVKLVGKNRQYGVDLIVQGLSTEPALAPPEWVYRPLPAYHARADMSREERSTFNKARDEELKQLRLWWIANMLQSNSPQTERLVLFWHDLFATNSYQVGKMPLAMARQNQTFRRLASGSWAQLLKAMIRDPALLRFLNAGSNHKASPNENLARELMELFVLGEGNYDETTVKQAARALTGHNTSLFYNYAFHLNTQAQDRGQKELFGQKGNFDGDALIDILVTQEQASRFLATRFWYAFIADYPPTEGWLDLQAKRFRQSELHIKILYRNVLQSEEFWQEEYRGAIVKSPIDIVVGTARTMNYPISHWQQMPRWQSLTGMDLLAPPDVSGWSEGAAFITPGRLLNRARVLRQLTRSPASSSRAEQQNLETNMMQADLKQASLGQGELIKNETLRSENLQGGKVRNSVVLSPSAKQTTNLETITASAIHVQGASKYQQNKTLTMDLVLDNVTTPSNEFTQVRFVLKKQPNQAFMMRLTSFSCWPSCIDPWPKCAWTDPNFAPMKNITLPWVESGHELWSHAYPHGCQFSSLSNFEKSLVSALWASLPELLEHAGNTAKVQNQTERFLPTINAIKRELQQANVEFADTPYFQHTLTLDVDASHTPKEPALEPFTPPIAQLVSFRELMTALELRKINIHELLMPDLQFEGLPDLAAVQNQSPPRYLRSIIEHPLFQLK